MATTQKSGKKPVAKGQSNGTGKNKKVEQPAYGWFGDSIIDEVILILVILISVVTLISLFSDRMGAIGGILQTLLLGLFGLGAVLLPLEAIGYCLWMLVKERKRGAVIRFIGGFLVLFSFASLVQVVHPNASGAEGVFERAVVFYQTGGFTNGGFFGALMGGGVMSAFGRWGSILIFMGLLLCGVIMATGKSFFRLIGHFFSKQEAKKKQPKQEPKKKVQPQVERGKTAQLTPIEKRSKGDYNFVLDKEKKQEKTPVVEETVFRRKGRKKLRTGPRVPIYDFVKEAEKIPLDGVMKEENVFLPEEDIAIELPNQEEIPRVFGVAEETALEKPTETLPVEIEESKEGGGLVFDDIIAEETGEPLKEPEEPESLEEPTPDEGHAVAEENKDLEQENKSPSQEKTEGRTPFALPKKEEIPYVFPPVSLLGEDNTKQAGGSRVEILQNAQKLEATLKSFGVEAKVIQINKGPTVTRYELSPSQGVKVSKIVNLADDIALNLAASGIRIEAPIPGKAAVGIEVPNKETKSVYLRSVIDSANFKNFDSKLAFALGEDIAGTPVVTDIAKMPHLLIAGATGSGKSVCINTLITSIIYKADPKEVKLLLVDPKVVELSVYNGIPHLLIPVVTDPKKASAALNWAVREMLLRYNDFAESGVRDIKGFNAMKKEKGEEEGLMSQIVIIIDELADLMMAAPGEVEDSICRLAQMARAAGMHLIIATQRPSVDVITGVIKANIPSRLAFAVSSGIDSRTILDMVGAEKLLGKGDMLFAPAGQSKPTRIQGAFVTDKEVESIVDFVKGNHDTTYDKEMVEKITTPTTLTGGSGEDEDEFFEQAVDLVIEKEKASVSMLQRQFRIGYNRAARLMDDLEGRGIVGQEDGSKPRKVLLTRSQWEEMKNPSQE